MEKVESKHNYGWGRSPKFAVKQAFQDYYRGSKETIDTRVTKFNDFLKFSRAQGLGKDISKYPANHLKDYAADVARRFHNGDMTGKTHVEKASYAHNLISNVNMAYKAMTGKNPGLSPKDELGISRSNIRETVPTGLDANQVKSVSDQLATDYPRTAATIAIERNLGLRAREAALMNCKVALREAEKHGYVNVTEGTKGGRGNHIDRHVPVTKPEQLEALRQAAAVQGNARNLIEPGKTWISHYEHNRYVLNQYQGEIDKQHDLRAAYACQRYEELTGCKAPVCREAEDPKPGREADRNARMTISKELGHNRIDVTNSYLGR